MGYSFRSAYLTVLPSKTSSSSFGLESQRCCTPWTSRFSPDCYSSHTGCCCRCDGGISRFMPSPKTGHSSPPLPASGYRKEDLKRTATTALGNFKEENMDNDLYSGDETEEFKDEEEFLSKLQSEVELENNGAVVTKICMEQNPPNNYDACFVMRNEV
ncbi:fibroblast growth factor receptor-like 1 [Caerostris darwini]|uniref:Fibroblast growth factor receptor-like 1 n=1 Tax=Caerostris darwini TaxID=1538125 RepID=A0AAV4S325_9ARAC|nr:fibroblast growth factor receptor-like 1 [Caerostris darwini]